MSWALETDDTVDEHDERIVAQIDAVREGVLA